MAMGYRVLARNRPPSERASLRVIYGYVRPHRLALLAGALLSLVTGATGLVLPLVVRALINDLSRHRGLSHLVVLMCLLMLVDAVLGAAGGYLLRRTADSGVLDTRKTLSGDRLRGAGRPGAVRHAAGEPGVRRTRSDRGRTGRRPRRHETPRPG